MIKYLFNLEVNMHRRHQGAPTTTRGRLAIKKKLPTILSIEISQQTHILSRNKHKSPILKTWAHLKPSNITTWAPSVRTSVIIIAIIDGISLISRENA